MIYIRHSYFDFYYFSKRIALHIEHFPNFFKDIFFDCFLLYNEIVFKCYSFSSCCIDSIEAGEWGCNSFPFYRFNFIDYCLLLS